MRDLLQWAAWAIFAGSAAFALTTLAQAITTGVRRARHIMKELNDEA